MPQMAPISWISLFFIFSFSFIIFNILNYFCFFNSISSQNMSYPLNKNNNNNKNNLFLIWKW